MIVLFLPWGRPDVDRKEEVQEELQDESFRRTFVGFTQAACQNTKKYINIRKFLQKNTSIIRTCYLYLLFFQLSCETFNKIVYYKYNIWYRVFLNLIQYFFDLSTLDLSKIFDLSKIPLFPKWKNRLNDVWFKQDFWFKQELGSSQQLA